MERKLLAFIGLVMVVSLSVAVISLSKQEEYRNASTTGTPNTQFTWKGIQWTIVGGDASIDANDNLHMVLRYQNGAWDYVSIHSVNPVHYGIFSTTVQTDLSYIQNTLDGGYPAFTFAPWLYDNNLPHGGELDIEQSRFNEGPTHTLHWTNHNTDATHPSQQITTVDSEGPNVTHTLSWQPTYIKWEADGGTTGHLEHTEAVPTLSPPDTTGTMHFILGVYGSYGGGRAPPTDPYSIEVVVTNVSMQQQPQPAITSLAIAPITTPIS